MNQTAENKQLPTIRDELERMGPEFEKALPRHIPVERFKRVLMTAISMNPDLVYAERRTLWSAAMRAAQDGLLPDGREGAMVIFNTKVKQGGQERWEQQVQWMPMIAGIRKKVRNSGEIVDWYAEVVHAKDAFEYELGDDPFIRHKPHLGEDRGPIIAAYSICTLKGGFKSRDVMPVDRINRVRQAAKSPDSPAWTKWFDEMCKKVVARRHSKVLPMNTDLDDLMRRDDELYDLEGAGDRNVAPIAAAPARPRIIDFQPTPEFTVDETKEKEPAKRSAKKAESAAEKEKPAKEPAPARTTDVEPLLRDVRYIGQNGWAEDLSNLLTNRAAMIDALAEDDRASFDAAVDEARQAIESRTAK